MGMVAVGMIGKRIKYPELIADNGLDWSQTRSGLT